MVYRLSAMDPVSQYIYDNKILTKDEFNSNSIKNFLKPIIIENNIKTIVTDGAISYPKILEEFEVEHKKCNFHKMQNFINQIKGNIRGLKNKIKNKNKKIKENEEKIIEIKEKRKGQKGRLKKDNEQEEKIVKEKKILEKENRQLRKEKRENKAELETYEKCTHNLSIMLKSKTKKTGLKRYQKIIDPLMKYQKKIRGFIKNIQKEIDKLLLHTTNKNIPTTNNCIELYFNVTLLKLFKKKYKTIKGVYREIRLKTIRWMKRIVLENKITN